MAKNQQTYREQQLKGEQKQYVNKKNQSFRPSFFSLQRFSPDLSPFLALGFCALKVF